MIRSMRTSIAMILCLSAAVPALAQGKPNPKELLGAIPADAWAVVTIPSLENLDAKAALLGGKLGMPMPPPAMMALGQLGLTEVVNTQGGAAIAMLNFSEFGPQGAVVFLPARQPAAMMKALAATAESEDGNDEEEEEDDGEGDNGDGGAKDKAGAKEEKIAGVEKCSIMGQSGYMAQKGKYVVVSQSKAACAAVLKSKKSLGDHLTKERATAYEKSDIVITVAVDSWLTGFADQINMMVGMASAMAGPEGAQLTDAVNEFISAAKQIATSDLCVSIDAAGVAFCALATPKSGSEIADSVGKEKPQTGSLLRGLAREKFLLAFGGQGRPERVKEEDVQKQVDTVLKQFQMADMVDKKQVKGMVSDAVAFSKMIRANAAACSVLPEGPDGIAGLAVVMDVSDSAAAMTKLGELVGKWKNLSTDEDFQKSFASMVTHKAGAETVGGSPVDHITIDLTGLEDEGVLDEEDLETLNKIVGKEGLLFRVGASGKNKVVLAIGGGAARFSKLVDAAGSSTGGMEDDGGIAKVSQQLPSRKTGEFYLAVDAIVEVVGRAMKAMGEDEEIPFKLSNLNAPVGGSATVDGGSYRLDLFVPMELVTAVKDAWMSSQAAGYDEDEEEDEDEAEDEDEDEDEDGQDEEDGE